MDAILFSANPDMVTVDDNRRRRQSPHRISNPAGATRKAVWGSANSTGRDHSSSSFVTWLGAERIAPNQTSIEGFQQSEIAATFSCRTS